ncbi:hypothetical protein JTE90_021563 [Oedothorax gibbosus]|uniref:SEC23-interacting protein n=1 Tax=Oedothorax gibbosus TaxID=931172 RepID=A0AAV6VNA6_9ARAC|nr:hypothetical protein JTE90_021563 [Oedothorax gibbosus]
MERNDKTAPFSESSILLQAPNPMLSLTCDNPLLMPVAVVPNEDIKTSSSSHNLSTNVVDTSKPKSTPAPLTQLEKATLAPLSQLEQPLLVRKPPVVPPPSVPPTNSSAFHATGNAFEPLQNIMPPPIYNPVQERRSSETYHDALKKSNGPGDESTFPPGLSAPTHFDVPRSYTEPRFLESPGSNIPRLFPDERTASVPSSPSDYNSCGFMSFPIIKPHWLFKDTVENKEVWYGFSEIDNHYLEDAFQKGSQNIVPTDGGRYDVFIDDKVKRSVYFDAKDLEVRRCTWFFQVNSSSRYIPYAEEIATSLEKQYYHCFTSRQWQRRFNLPGIGSFSFENPEVMFQFRDDLEVWPTLPDSKASPITVKRGLPDGFEILPSEHTNINHLVFIVQGIGSFCDLRFRTVSQCVDGFRDIANKLIASHFKQGVEQGKVGRIEFLPVAWHSKLHTSDIGLDRKMKKITLPSIPKLRHFTNDTLLDILLYSTPTYCQSIIDTVAYELNQMYKLFLERNPTFNGKVFVSGHSLGSLILFDILANQQKSTPECKSKDVSQSFEDVISLLKHLNLEDYLEAFSEQELNIESLKQLSIDDLMNKGISDESCRKLLNYFHPKREEPENAELSIDLTYNNEPSTSVLPDEIVNQNDVIFPYGTPNNGMSLIDYPSLKFSPAGFFALGSPIAMFLSVRGYDKISENFEFPTCPALYHIFHPYDPVAFRIEPLIDPEFSEKPVLIPHHKGRKRLHLEIRENVAKFASEIKQKVTETMRFTWNSLNEFAKNHSFPSTMVTDEVDKLLELKMSETDDTESTGTQKDDVKIGMLNGGRRIDYVLQEKPIEALNDYVFALTSHATYWDSEDTVLLILREIYGMQGITISTDQTDRKVSAASSLPQFQIPTNKQLPGVNSQHVFNPVNDQWLHVEPSSSRPNEFATGPAMLPTTNIQLVMPPVSNIQAAMQPTSNIQPAMQPTSNIQPAMQPTSNIQHAMDYAQPNASAVYGTAENIGPPPLSGFVKRSPFMH